MNTISILVIKQDAEKFIESLRYGLENKADIFTDTDIYYFVILNYY